MTRRLAAVLGALAAVCLFGEGVAKAEASPERTARVVIHADRPGAVIAPEIQGQFVEHLGHGVYDGIWVGEGSPIPNIHGYRRDVVDALRAIHVPVIRWPGGCFADSYHWRDGVGPRERRPVRLNMVWGGVEETNAFGTHEFMDFAELIGARTYLAANVGGGTVGEMTDWIEYITSPSHSTLANERRANGRAAPWKLDFIGIGNESWGCGGSMRADYYADLFRQYATFVRPGGPPVIKVASGAGADDTAWTETLMAKAGDSLDAISLHYYTIATGDWGHKGSATAFGEGEWIGAVRAATHMDELIAHHEAVMDRYDPKKRVGLFVDEWGAWDDPEPGTNGAFLYQQNSLRDAITAAITLDIFAAHADRVRMANLAQMVNVLQALILTDGERMTLTPTYHVFDLYQVFQGATVLPVEVSAPDYGFGGAATPGLSVSAAHGRDGTLHLALVNPDPNHPLTVAVALAGGKAAGVSGRILTALAMNAVNTFDRPQTVRPQPFAGARLSPGGLTVRLPPKAIVVLDLN